MSKLFTVLALLLQGEQVDWKSPVTEWIPELLQARNDGVDWKIVTLEALGSQLSGIVRECKCTWVVNSLGWSERSMRGRSTHEANV